MASKYISTTETAKLIRKSLKEAFPGVKFSVCSHKYAGGSSINVRWTDGPTTEQVDEIVNRFEGSYFDGSIDYKGSRYAMLNGEQVHFSVDFIFTSRGNSDGAIINAMAALVAKYPGNFRDYVNKFGALSLEEFKTGALWNRMLIEGGCFSEHSMQAQINKVLAETSLCETSRSNTAGAVFVTHDDGYSRFCTVSA